MTPRRRHAQTARHRRRGGVATHSVRSWRARKRHGRLLHAGPVRRAIAVGTAFHFDERTVERAVAFWLTALTRLRAAVRCRYTHAIGRRGLETFEPFATVRVDCARRRISGPTVVFDVFGADRRLRRTRFVGWTRSTTGTTAVLDFEADEIVGTVGVGFAGGRCAASNLNRRAVRGRAIVAHTTDSVACLGVEDGADEAGTTVFVNLTTPVAGSTGHLADTFGWTLGRGEDNSHREHMECLHTEAQCRTPPTHSRRQRRTTRLRRIRWPEQSRRTRRKRRAPEYRRWISSVLSFERSPPRRDEEKQNTCHRRIRSNSLRLSSAAVPLRASAGVSSVTRPNAIPREIDQVRKIASGQLTQRSGAVLRISEGLAIGHSHQTKNRHPDVVQVHAVPPIAADPLSPKTRRRPVRNPRRRFPR